MYSEVTERNIQTQMHRFESLKIHIHKVNRFTGILQSRMHSCARAHTPPHTHTHTHTHTRTGGSVASVQLGWLRFPVYFRRQNALTEPFGTLPYFLQVCGRVFRFIIENRIDVFSAVDEYIF